MNAIPKAVKVEMMATLLKITFDDGTVKYLKSHLNEEYAKAFSMKKGKKANFLLSPQATWLGTKIEIKTDGTVVENEKDYYSPEECWNESTEHINIP